MKINLRKSFWYLILALPVLAYLFSLLAGQTVTFADISYQFALPVADTLVGQTLVGIFGVDGVLPLVTADFMSYFSYFVGVELIHVSVDVILFLVKVVQKAFEKLDKEHDS